MKKFMILAGILTTICACKDEEVFDPSNIDTSKPAGVFTSKIASVYYALPAENVYKFTAKQVNTKYTGTLQAKVEARWEGDKDNDGDDATGNVIRKLVVAVSVDGSNYTDINSSSPTASTTSNSFDVPADDGAAVYLKVKCSTLLGSRETAKLRLLLRTADGEPLHAAVVNIAAARPIGDVPKYSPMEKRKNSTTPSGSDSLPDTLYFGINNFYSTTPEASDYRLEVARKANGATDAFAYSESSWRKFLTTDGGELGIVVPEGGEGRSSWLAGDTIGIRVILPNMGGGFADTAYIKKFVVAADKLPTIRSFTSTGKQIKQENTTHNYFALLANKSVDAYDANKYKQYDLVFYLDTAADEEVDSKFTLKAMGSMDSSSIAYQSCTEGEYNSGLRTSNANSGAQDKDWSTTTLNSTLRITSDVGGSQFYAMKVAAWKAVDKTDANGNAVKDSNGKVIKIKVAVTYYGYLRLRMFVGAGTGSMLDRVEVSFKYGEARDYTRE